MKSFPANPEPGFAISARFMGSVIDSARDGQISGSPGMLLSGVPGASALLLPETYEPHEWGNPFPFGPGLGFGLAFREPDPDFEPDEETEISNPRLRVYPGAWRYRNKIVVSPEANLEVTDDFRWVVLELTPHATAATAAVKMWDEACDYTDEFDDIETIHDKNGKIYVPLCVCHWVQNTSEPPVAYASLKKWWLPVSLPVY